MDYLSAALVTCGNAGQAACKLSDLFVLAKTIIDFLLKVMIPLAGASVAVAGIMLVTAGSNEKTRDTAKSLLWYTGIGLGLALGAWLLVSTIVSSLGLQSALNPLK